MIPSKPGAFSESAVNRPGPSIGAENVGKRCATRGDLWFRMPFPASVREAHITTGIKRNDWRIVSETRLPPPARLYAVNVPKLLALETA
jgi:hypothetical protein